MSTDFAGDGPSPTAEWYRRAFGDLYLDVYSHRDPDEARGIVSWLADAASIEGARVCDLACGAARFFQPIADAGARAYVGVDYSMPLLRRARASASASETFFALIRADMRAVPLRAASIDLLLSMFTSFGYFDDAGNRRVLGEAARLLRPGGRLVLDIVNPDWLERTLVPESVREEAGGVVVREAREVRGHHVRKRVAISRDGTPLDTYIESVRLFRRDELDSWLGAVGLTRLAIWGDYAGGAFDPAGSPRLIALATKERS